MVQDEFQTKEVSQPLRNNGQNRCDDNVYSSQQAKSTVSEEPVKSLGSWHDSSMKDTKRGQETAELATEGLIDINRCGLQGKFKVCCLQFMIISKFL